MNIPDNSLWSELYSRMFKSRYFEQSIADLWHKGLISGEMHLGMGEEAIVAGILSHLIDGDGKRSLHCNHWRRCSNDQVKSIYPFWERTGDSSTN